LEAVDISGSTKLVLGGSFSIVESSITVIWPFVGLYSLDSRELEWHLIIDTTSITDSVKSLSLSSDNSLILILT
jgi:hypothetical protein